MNDQNHEKQDPIDPNSDGSQTLAALRGVKDGSDPSSWIVLHGKVCAFVANFYPKQTPLPHLVVDDLQQEVMLRVLRDVAGFEIKSRSQFWSWIKTVSRNAYLDAKKEADAAKRTPPGGGRVLDLAPEMGDDGDYDMATPSMGARAAELAAVHLECVAAIQTEIGRKVYEIRWRRGLLFRDIAAEVGHSTDAVTRGVYAVARQQVMECMQRKLGDGYSTYLSGLPE